VKVPLSVLDREESLFPFLFSSNISRVRTRLSAIADNIRIAVFFIVSH